MPETFTWGPVREKNAEQVRHFFFLTPLKYLVGHTFHSRNKNYTTHKQ